MTRPIDPPSGLLRRDFVHRGLGGLALFLTQPSLIACGSKPNGSAAADGGACRWSGGGRPAEDGGQGVSVVPSSIADGTETRTPAITSRMGELGPLGNLDRHGVRLPHGFTSRVVARAGTAPVPSAPYLWHPAPDGGATFEAPDKGWVYVSNSEMVPGGCGALRFDRDGNVVDAYSILHGTADNCAGGKTPWGTWLSCEEVPAIGRVFECDPFGDAPAVERSVLGRFNHEAIAVDPANPHLYLTEDDPNGRLYRYVADALTPEGFADLSTGRLEVARVGRDGVVTWLPLPDASGVSGVTREQVPESTPFDGGEGIWHHAGVIYFATKGDNRVWAYGIAARQLGVLYDAAVAAEPILTGVDNLTVSCCGDVLVAEDGGDMQIVAVLPDGTPRALLQVVGHDRSEITGIAFDPSGQRLYFSSQRGPSGVLTDGWTFEITGPFREVG